MLAMIAPGSTMAIFFLSICLALVLAFEFSNGFHDEDDLAAELRFLEREVYLREVELRRDVLTAYERYRPA